jgi:hypothetical protein
MGRYYSGDIDGKFWFGVQASDDADFFGVTGSPSYIEYYFDLEDKDKVKNGIEKCESVLSTNLKRLDEFFDSNGGYNDQMLIEYWKEKFEVELNKDSITEMLRWYARYYLGKKIFDCIEEQGQCGFSAEL